MDKWTDGGMNGGLDGWMDGWMDRWMDGWVSNELRVLVVIFFHFLFIISIHNYFEL